jgi:hypothetical protein
VPGRGFQVILRCKIGISLSSGSTSDMKVHGKVFIFIKLNFLNQGAGNKLSLTLSGYIIYINGVGTGFHFHEGILLTVNHDKSSSSCYTIYFKEQRRRLSLLSDCTTYFKTRCR